jgi:hypothetical protein
MKSLHWMEVPYIAHNLQLGDASEGMINDRTVNIERSS